MEFFFKKKTIIFKQKFNIIIKREMKKIKLFSHRSFESNCNKQTNNQTKQFNNKTNRIKLIDI